MARKHCITQVNPESFGKGARPYTSHHCHRLRLSRTRERGERERGERERQTERERQREIETGPLLTLLMLFNSITTSFIPLVEFLTLGGDFYSFLVAMAEPTLLKKKKEIH